MRARETGGKRLILFSMLAIGGLMSQAVASPHTRGVHHSIYTRARQVAHHLKGKTATAWRNSHRRQVASISCVPYARNVSGIEVKGNAWEWWENAAGLYPRGHVPQVGAVLVYQSNRQMPLGHVAVVSHIFDSREIEVDQANWPHGGIERGTMVIDVSARNDWSAVRVEIGESSNYGSIYPTYGFIYHRDHRPIVTASAAGITVPDLNPAPSDLRRAPRDEELAEAPSEPVHSYYLPVGYDPARATQQVRHR
jgi:surface antigen